MIRVAIADDSPFTCNLLASYIEEGGDCQVVGMAHDAGATLRLVRATRPDVLTLDLQMPGGNGLDLLRELTDGPPTAVVVISGVTKLAASTTLRALELGAVDFILKFTPGAPQSRASLKREILTKVKLAAAARPATRQLAAVGTVAAAPAGLAAAPAGLAAAPPAIPVPRFARPWTLKPTAPSSAGVLVIGASTGGPRAIGELLEQLPADYAVPTVIVQHLPASFTAPFAAQLGRRSRLAVKEAEPGDRLIPGRALVAPGSFHLILRGDGGFDLQPVADDDMYRPSIDRTMASAAESYGTSTIGVILTGMGHDGAEGLKRIHDAGGETYVQDAASCTMSSMPERAIERAGADHIAKPERIGQMLAAGRSKP